RCAPLRSAPADRIDRGAAARSRRDRSPLPRRLSRRAAQGHAQQERIHSRAGGGGREPVERGGENPPLVARQARRASQSRLSRVAWTLELLRMLRSENRLPTRIASGPFPKLR